jgi:hypothetical protein
MDKGPHKPLGVRQRFNRFSRILLVYVWHVLQALHIMIWQYIIAYVSAFVHEMVHNSLAKAEESATVFSCTTIEATTGCFQVGLCCQLEGADDPGPLLEAGHQSPQVRNEYPPWLYGNEIPSPCCYAREDCLVFFWAVVYALHYLKHRWKKYWL